MAEVLLALLALFLIFDCLKPPKRRSSRESYWAHRARRDNALLRGQGQEPLWTDDEMNARGWR